MDVAHFLGIRYRPFQTYFLIALLSGMGISASAADSLDGSVVNPWFIGVSVGVTKPSLQKNSSTTVPNGSGQSSPYDVDVYSVSKPGSQENLALFVGYRWMRNTAFLPQYSLILRYQRVGAFSVSGDITQYSLYTNYSYHLNATASNLMLLGKADLCQFHSFSPYVSVGVGQASNKMDDYSEQAFSGITPRTSPGYGGTSSQFAYNLGLGVDYSINTSFSASLGYEYANLGKLKANGTSTWAGDTLSFGSVTSSTVLLSVSYQLPPV